MQQEQQDGDGRGIKLNGTGSLVSGCSVTVWEPKAVYKPVAIL